MQRSPERHAERAKRVRPRRGVLIVISGGGVGPALKGVCRGCGARGPCSGDESMIRLLFVKKQGIKIGCPELSTGFNRLAAVGPGRNSTSWVIGEYRGRVPH